MRVNCTLYVMLRFLVYVLKVATRRRQFQFSHRPHGGVDNGIFHNKNHAHITYRHLFHSQSLCLHRWESARQHTEQHLCQFEAVNVYVLNELKRKRKTMMPNG